MKQVGFISYFLDLNYSKDRETVSADAQRDSLGTEELLVQHQYKASRLSIIADSLVSESLLLFLGGISIAMIGFVGETTVKALTLPVTAVWKKVVK